jgi:hypothetical protein
MEKREDSSTDPEIKIPTQPFGFPLGLIGTGVMNTNETFEKPVF